MKNNIDKTVIKKCAVCGSDVKVDQFGQGQCLNCTWYNGDDAEFYNERVVFPNLVSLNKAKKLIQDNKAIKPDLDDFIGMFLFYGEVEFTYKGVEYEMSRKGNDGGNYFGYSLESVKIYGSTEEFRENAKTHDGKFLRDVWDEVEDAKYI